jgi:hypothetical protein
MLYLSMYSLSAYVDIKFVLGLPAVHILYTRQTGNLKKLLLSSSIAERYTVHHSKRSNHSHKINFSFNFTHSILYHFLAQCLWSKHCFLNCKSYILKNLFKFSQIRESSRISFRSIEPQLLKGRSNNLECRVQGAVGSKTFLVLNQVSGCSSDALWHYVCV